MISSAIKTSSGKNKIEFCIYLDNEYLKDPPEFQVYSHVTYKLFYGPILPTSTMTNFMFSQSTGSVIMYAADDIVFRTPNWDLIVIETLDNPQQLPSLLVPNDGSPNYPKIATHAFVTKRMTDLLGYLLPPYFESEFCDTWLTSIARASGRITFASNVLIEHMHPTWNKSTIDATYESRKDRYRHLEQFIYFKIKFLMRKREISLLKNNT